MITDMIDLEPLLDQYDSETILVGPLLSLPLSSSYRYFDVAGKGAKVYNSLGLGFVENEYDAQKRRAEIIEKLKGRFASLVTFDSQGDLARAVHARWRSEETARVLSCAEIAARAEPTKVADYETTIKGSEGCVLLDEQSKRLVGALPDEQNKRLFDVLARELSERLDQDDAAKTEQSASSKAAVHERKNGSPHESAPTNSNDQFFCGLQEPFDSTSRDRDAKRAPAADRPASAHVMDIPLASAEPTSKPESTRAAGHENTSGVGGPPEVPDQIVDILPPEPVDHTGGNDEGPVEPLPAARLPLLTNRLNDSSVKPQHRDFALTEDALASAILKLKSESASQSYGLPISTAAPMQIEPDGTVTSRLERYRTSTILRFAALGAVVVLVSISLMPNTRQRMGQLMLGTVPASVADNSSGEIQPPRSVASATTAQPLEVENTRDAVANTSEHQSPAAAAPSAEVSSPAQLLEADSSVAAGASVPGQHEAAPAASTAASSPAAQTSEVDNTESAGASISNPSAPTAQQARTADRPNTEEVAKLVDRGMRSLESGDVESARLALGQATQALSGPPVPPSTSSGRANDAAQAATPQTARMAGPDPHAAMSEAGGQKPSGPSQPENLDVANAPVTEQTRPAQGDSMTRRLDPDEIAMLLKRGMDFLNNGDLGSARFSLQRAAEAGNAEAALALGSTYDPLVLKQLGAIGIAPDLVRARQWYHKAADLGSSTAQRRLAGLAQSGQ